MSMTMEEFKKKKTQILVFIVVTSPLGSFDLYAAYLQRP